MVEGDGEAGRGAVPPPRLEVGGLVAGGRYQLLEAHGGVAGQAFWRAHDKRLGRDVALTFVDPLPGEEPPGSATGVLDRTVALTGVYSDGLARVLDVIRGRAGGIVVSEWVPGRSLASACAATGADAVSPDTAVTAVRPLADAAARAEEKGLVLALDTPDRIRLTEDGRALLAFAGVGAEADTRGDVRGLGAVLYALLTGAWPGDLPEGSDAHQLTDPRPDPAPRGDDGEVADPTRVRDGVPPEAAVLAIRSLDGTSVSSAATVRSMIDAAPGAPLAAAATTAAHRPAATASGAGASGPRADEDRYDDPDGHDGRYSEPYTPPDDATLQRRWRIMAGAGAAAVVAIALLAAWLFGAFSASQDDAPLAQQLDAIERAAQQSRSAAASPTDAPADAGESRAPEPSTPVEVSDATTWQPSSSPGVAENAASAPNVVDGDRSTTWSTDSYLNQFGDGGSAYKPGLGLMLTLDGAQEVRRVVLQSGDDGVEFEVRASDGDSPSSLGDTTLLGKGTVRGGSGTATIDEPEETEHLLVWITRLGTQGPQSYRATVSEIVLTR